MNPGITSGTRYFYFTFKPLTSSIDMYFSRNQYSNEEFITRIFTPRSSTSLLVRENVSNLVMPIMFRGNQLYISTPPGSTYVNNSMLANCKINNLVPGSTYILESKTLYNDRGIDFGVIIKSGQIAIDLMYIQTSLTPTTPTITMPPMPTPPPITPIPPTGLPPIPTGLVASNITAGVLLSWSPSTNATSYKVYRCGQLLASPNSTTCVDSYASSGVSYIYSVSAVNSGGESAKSSTVTHAASFTFTSLTPDILPGGPSITGPVLRYYYFLVTPITPSLDVYLCANGNSNEEAIIGLYDSSAPNTNLMMSGSISNLDSNVKFGNQQLGAAPNPTISIPGISVSRTVPGMYMNAGTVANFRINNLLGNASSPNSVVKTYILEIVSVNNDSDVVAPDFGAYCKNVSSDIHNGYNTQLVFNSVSVSRSVPTPYVIAYNFALTSADNYSKYIFPHLYVFQNVKNVLESMISTSPGARGPGRMNDMLVNFKVDALGAGIVGESSLTGWKVDSGRSPDFSYEQDITFSNTNFTNGYFGGAASFNGATTVNGRASIALFGTLLHEMLHGIGIFYSGSYNTGNSDVGWTPFLTGVAQNDPWYKGPATGTSSALTNYIQYVGNTGIQRVPIENDYGEGTALSHWDEGDSPGLTQQFRKFNNVYCPSLRLEIMTGFLNKNDYLTGLTAGALKDYGYNVNMLSPYIVHYPSGLIPVSPLQRYSLDEYVQIASQPAFKCQCLHEGNKVKHRIVDQSVKMCMSTMSTMMLHQSTITLPMLQQSSIMLPMARNNMHVSPWWYNNMPYEDLGCIWLSPYQTYPLYYPRV